MSMLRTLRDTGNRTPVLLIYGTSQPERTLFLEELQAMSSQMDLHVVHVFENGPADWAGERGMITSELLERRLPAADTGYHALVCGPAPMMDIAERLLKDHDVPLRRMRSERFDIV
jgi:ferredoxin-NADP reductase